MAKHPSVQVPGLAVVLVGTRKDSETYVRNKRKNCEEVGFESFQTDLPEDVSQQELLKVSLILIEGKRDLCGQCSSSACGNIVHVS